jgi:hypothetical protein
VRADSYTTGLRSQLAGGRHCARAALAALSDRHTTHVLAVALNKFIPDFVSPYHSSSRYIPYLSGVILCKVSLSRSSPC